MAWLYHFWQNQCMCLIHVGDHTMIFYLKLLVLCFDLPDLPLSPRQSSVATFGRDFNGFFLAQNAMLYK